MHIFPPRLAHWQSFRMPWVERTYLSTCRFTSTYLEAEKEGKKGRKYTRMRNFHNISILFLRSTYKNITKTHSKTKGMGRNGTGALAMVVLCCMVVPGARGTTQPQASRYSTSQLYFVNDYISFYRVRLVSVLEPGM